MTNKDGKVTGQWFLGAFVYSCVVYTVSLKAALETTYWTLWNHIAIWGSMFIWFIFTFIYFNLWESGSFGGIGAEVYGVDIMMYSSGMYWFGIFLIPTMALSRDYL